MNKIMKRTLNNCSKEQLLYILEMYHHTSCVISEYLVSESKQEISKEDVIELIRNKNSDLINFLDYYDKDFLLKIQEQINNKKGEK